MSLAENKEVFDKIGKSKIVAVLVIDEKEVAAEVAHALLEGGINAIELALRTPCAIDALKEIKNKVPEMIVGAGTVLTQDQVKQVYDVGCDFGFAPGNNPRVLEKAIEIGLPFAPGVCTPSDIELALEFDYKVLKFFPAEPLGGVNYLKSIAAPYAHLNLQFIPLGGITQTNYQAYINLPSVPAVGGSWIAPRQVIKDRNWDVITLVAKKAQILETEMK